jgi:hypothetical protein
MAVRPNSIDALSACYVSVQFRRLAFWFRVCFRFAPFARLHDGFRNRPATKPPPRGIIRKHRAGSSAQNQPELAI